MERDSIADGNRLLEAQVEIQRKRAESFKFWLDVYRSFAAHDEAELAVTRRALRVACESLASRVEDAEAVVQRLLDVARSEVGGRTSS